MRIPSDFIQELKDRNDIVSVASGYMTLKKAGRIYKGLCPFHGEKTPSFVVYPENGSFYCFGCNTGGDVITFVMKIENLDYIEALKSLAQRAGMSMPEDNYDDSSARLKQRIYEANREAARFFNSQLYTEEGKQALGYLINRGLTKKTITHFGLGYAPKFRFSLVNYLRSLKFTENEIVSANLGNRTKSGNAVIDRYENRVMFPIIDVRGNVIGFGGRKLDPEQKAKYINTSDTLVFNKSKNLFSLNNARKSGEDTLVLCEGYMDVISVYQAGITNAVATLGTALTQDQAMIMKRYADEVVICYDSDAAGMTATQRAIPILRNAGITVRVLNIPDAKDPDEFLKKNGDNGPAAFRKLIKGSSNDIDYRLDKLKNMYDLNSMQGKIDYLNAAVKLLSGIDNSIERDIYCSKISMDVDVDKRSIMEQVQRIRSASRKRENKEFNRDLMRNSFGQDDRINNEHKKYIRAAGAEEAVISCMINRPEMYGYIKERIGADDFVTIFNKRLFAYFSEQIEHNEIPTINIAADFSPEECSKIIQIQNNYKSNLFTDKAVDEYIKVIKEESHRMSDDDIRNSSRDDFEEYIRKQKEKRKKKEVLSNGTDT